MSYEFTPEFYWKELHETNGNSAVASRGSKSVLDRIDTTDPTRRKERAEFARISAVTGIAAVKKSKTFAEAREHLIRVLEVVNAHYPLAETVDEANERSQLWDEVYGPEQSAQLICLVDVLSLLKTLSRIVPVEDVIKMLGGIEYLLQQVTKDNEEQFALIFIIEHGGYAEAKAAFGRYAKLYGRGKQAYQPTQMLTVAARMAGRAVDEKDFVTVAAALQICALVVGSQPQLRSYAFKELAKNFSKKFKENHLEKKYSSWQEAASAPTAQPESQPEFKLPIEPEHNTNENLHAGITSLLRKVFVGTNSGVRAL